MDPIVSICCITYNHEKYIGQAIESVLMQKTNFSFELVIGDDFSKDNTKKICLKYKQKFPVGKIRNYRFGSNHTLSVRPTYP